MQMVYARRGVGVEGLESNGLGMSLDDAQKPHDRLAVALAGDMEAVNVMIRERMASKHAPRIPEVTAHLVEAGGKRLRPMLVLAAARMLWLRRALSCASGGDGGVYPHRDPAA